MISLTIIGFVCLSVFLLLVVFYMFNNKTGLIICAGLIGLLFFCEILQMMATLHKYRFSHDSISHCYLCFSYQTLKFEQIEGIVISNAVYNISKLDGNYGDYPMIGKRKKFNGQIEKVQYPYLSITLSNMNINKFKRGMNCRQLVRISTDSIINIGICWFEAFEELISRTFAEIYILEDVYMRYSRDFEQIINNVPYTNERVYIITDTAIKYKEYHNQNNNM